MDIDMKIFILVLFMQNTGVPQRTNLEFKSKRECEAFVRKITDMVKYRYCQEVIK